MTTPLRTTRRRIAFGATLVVVLAATVAALAVPSRPAAATPLSGDLSRDLDLASAAGVSLAGSTVGTQIVSAVELGGAPERAPAAATRRPAAPERAAAPRRAPVRRPRPEPRVEPRPEPAPVVEVEASRNVEPEAAPAIDAAAPVSPLPRPTPNERRVPPPGGWKTPSEVIRNAPFPINP